MTLRLLTNIFLLIAFLLNTPAFAEDNNIYYEQTPLLMGGVSQYNELPPELYGTWMVVGTMIKTDAPYKFKPKTNDIWTLEQINDKIILKNPESGAETYVNVEEVIGNNAKFNYESGDERVKHTETPDITVNNNEFTGTNLFSLFYYNKKGRLVHSESCLFQVYGKKISGATPVIMLRGK